MSYSKNMKNLEEIIDFIEQTGEKCLIIHQDKGAYVVLKVEEYKNLLANKKKIDELASLSKPQTDVRLYEIPRLETEDEKYYPEPLI